MSHKYSDKIIGIWKFADKVSPETLAEIAEKWAQEDPRYDHLYVRKVSKDQHGIGFEYRAYEGSDSENHKQAYNDYFQSMTDKLKREFGNDLVGWDISSSAIIIDTHSKIVREKQNEQFERNASRQHLNSSK